MTPKEAKELSLKVWEYLAAHPEIKRKTELPRAMYQSIEDCTCGCPLCDLYYDSCKECPLQSCTSSYSAFQQWSWSLGTDYTRREAAQRIVDKLKAWEPE